MPMQHIVALALFRLGASSLPPQREMRSDGHFMEKDYPSDVRAKVTKIHTKYGFDHPYPILQEDHDYDADYVRDENDDGGEYKAQEVYDYLRHQHQQYKAQVDRLKAKLAEDEGNYKEKMAIEAKLEAASKAADAEFEAAKKAADKAQDLVDDLKAQIAEAQGTVDKETNELDECRKELKSAKTNLDHELDKHRSAEEAAKAKYEKQMGQYRRNQATEAGAIDAAADADDDVSQAEGKEDAAENAVDDQKNDLRAAQAAYDAALAKVKKTEALLEEAAAKLAKFRRGEDPDGGVYNVLAEKKSAAWRMGGVAVPCAMVVLALFFIF